MVFGLSVLTAACTPPIPDQKPFPGYAKAPDASGSPVAAASAVAEAPPIETLARKAETSRLTLDRSMEAMRRRLTQLKQQIVVARTDLKDQDAARADPDRSGTLRQAERQVNLALARTRMSTSRGGRATVSEQVSTINDLSSLIVSVSGVVHTIAGREAPVVPSAPADAAIAGLDTSRIPVSRSLVLEGPPAAEAVPALPPPAAVPPPTPAVPGWELTLDMSRIRASRPTVAPEPPATAPPAPAAPVVAAPDPAVPASSPLLDLSRIRPSRPLEQPAPAASSAPAGAAAPAAPAPASGPTVPVS